jgi:hypothetical protein
MHTKSVFFRMTLGKKAIARPRHRWKNNGHGRDRWRALVKTTVNIRIP